MARILAKTKDMPREEWLKYRRTGIGGSDAATVCGLNPYGSLIELWADKTGRLPDKEDTEAMRTGRDLEEYVAQRFCEVTGKRVERRNAIFQHDEYDFITANIDRKIVGENAGLECKTTSAFNRSDFENGEIPRYYYVQCMHYMNVMGFDKMYLAVLVMGKAFYWFEIPYSIFEGEALLKMEVDFWYNHIIPDVRPEPDGSESAKETLDAVFHERVENMITIFEQEEIAAKLAEINARIKDDEAEKKRLQQTLVNSLETNTRGITVNYEISYLARSRSGVDGKKLKAQFPEVYEQVKTESSYNVFGIKERKVI
ncbi:MAG: YqaJ viral recombinase family protein [Lachnospiraceae bacterium]|nr:YqaJ viral recombinase family protein [Ruminococcus sp.]MCM1277075.1 YqaJ viral recombinase family protein [Lachnospiraceae bacterium]